MKSQLYWISSHPQSRSETFLMGPARRSRAGGQCQRDAATWPAPAPEGAGAGQAPPRLITMRTPLRDALLLCPRPASMGAPSLFPGRENLSGAERILSVRLSETRDSGARASRLRPNVTPARCSLLTRLVPVLRQADGQCEHRPGAGSFRHRPESRQTISYPSGVRPACGAVTCFRCAHAHRW